MTQWTEKLTDPPQNHPSAALIFLEDSTTKAVQPHSLHAVPSSFMEGTGYGTDARRLHPVKYCCVVPIKDETDSEWAPDATDIVTLTWTLTTTPPLLHPRR